MTHQLLCCASSMEGGGSERQLWQLACGMHRLHWPTQVYLLYRKGHFLEKLPNEIPVYAWDDCESNNLSQGRAGGTKLVSAQQSLIRRLVTDWLPGSIHRQQVQHLAQVITNNRIGVVYDRGFHCTLVASAACRAAKVARVSVIVSPPSRDFGLSRERYKSRKYRLLKQAYSDRKAIALAVSQPTAVDATDYFQLPPGKVVAVPNPVDIAAIQNAALERTEITNGELRIVMAARLTPEKRHSLLLEAAARWRSKYHPENLKLIIDILGEGPLQSELEALASRLGLQHMVRFQGFQNNPYPWIARAHLVCIPSEYEGMSNVALESMALGTPVIASAASQLQNILGTENERGIVLASDSYDELANAIQAVAENPKWIRRMTHSAQQWIRDHHSIDNWLGKMQEVFDASVRLLRS